MNLQDQIAAFAAEAETRTGRSKLETYEPLIRTLRQKRWTYAEISVALGDRFQVSVAPGTVHSFMRVRARKGTTPLAAERLTATPAVPPSASTLPRQRHRFNVDA